MKKIILSGFLSLMATTGLTSVAEATTCSISGSIDFAYTGAIETCTVTQAGLYGVTAVGGGGGGVGGLHFIDAQGDISLSSGETISIIVGGGPVFIVPTTGYTYYTGAGGSFVFQGSGSGATPLIVAGGGGGGANYDYGANASVTTSGTAGNGGAGGGVNGGNGVNSYGQGGEGYLAILATPTPLGGVFGGGSSGNNGGYGSGGGGGGYSGGGGGDNGGGGGGGSFVISTATNVLIASDSNTNIYSNGTVDFAITNTTASSPPSSVPEPSAIAVFASAIAGLVFARFWLKRRKA